MGIYGVGRDNVGTHRLTQAAHPPPAAMKHPVAARSPNIPVAAPRGRQTVEAEAQAVPQQAKMQVAVAAGPVSTVGVLHKLNSTMRDTKMVMELMVKIFISSCC